MHHPTDRITYTTAFVTPVVEHWLEREIPQFLAIIVVFTGATIGAGEAKCSPMVIVVAWSIPHDWIRLVTLDADRSEM